MRGWVSKKLAGKPQGVTSLMLVLAIGLVLTVMVAGITAITVREQQKARNTEFSNRALQTAEAGIDAAAQKLAKNSSYSKTGCDPADYAGLVTTDANQQITCIEVKSLFSNFEGYLEKDRTSIFFLNSPLCDTTSNPAGDPNAACAKTSANSLLLRWNSSADVSSNFSCTDNASCFYAASSGYNHAAAMEIGFVYWPKSNPAAMKNEANIGTVFVMPGSDDKGYSASNKGAGFVQSKCADQNPAAGLLGDYKCVATNGSSANGFNIESLLGIAAGSINNYTVAIRVTPRYTNTHYQLAAYDANGQEVLLKSTKAQIDVTAKVGNLYRRVKAERVVLPTAVEGIFDSVLYTGKGSGDNASKDICKSFKVDTNGNVISSPNNCP
jgi:hypothetical protein